MRYIKPHVFSSDETLFSYSFHALVIRIDRSTICLLLHVFVVVVLTLQSECGRI